MSGRKKLSKAIRFEVFKRDKFTCQYCGAKAPDVVLHVDHIEPLASGGTDDLMNLVTSCEKCNLGKGAKRLSDSSTIEMKRTQLAQLAERREQIEMMMAWQRELQNLGELQLDQLSEFWSELTDPFSLNEKGRSGLRKLIRRYGLDEVAEAMRIATDQYLEFDDEKPTHKSVERAWSKVGGICSVRRSEETNPNIRELLYIRGILRNRLAYLDERYALTLLEQAVDLGAEIERLKQQAREVRNWSQWRDEIEEFIRDNE